MVCLLFHLHIFCVLWGNHQFNIFKGWQKWVPHVFLPRVYLNNHPPRCPSSWDIPHYGYIPYDPNHAWEDTGVWTCHVCVTHTHTHICLTPPRHFFTQKCQKPSILEVRGVQFMWLGHTGPIQVNCYKSLHFATSTATYVIFFLLISRRVAPQNVTTINGLHAQYQKLHVLQVFTLRGPSLNY